MDTPRFHLAYHVTDLDRARAFYVGVLGCTEGRSAPTWLDFDFQSHQLSLHLGPVFQTALTGQVDGIKVPMPHFGLCMHYEAWLQLTQRIHKAGVAFLIEPYIRYKGNVGEQGTAFFLDPFGNPIELKGFKNFQDIFKSV